MPMTLIKSRYQTKLKLRTQNNKPQKPTEKSSLPPSPQSSTRKLLSGNGFMIYKWVQKIFN